MDIEEFDVLMYAIALQDFETAKKICKKNKDFFEKSENKVMSEIFAKIMIAINLRTEQNLKKEKKIW